MKFKLNVGTIKLNSKPTKDSQVGIIRNSLNNIVEIDILQLTRVVLNFPFTPSVLRGGSSATNWESQQVFVLDFDNGFTPDEFLERIRKYEMEEPTIIYTSFSDSPEKRKFRVVFVLDEPILDFDHSDNIRQGLFCLFPEADKSCLDAPRFFYPGKNIIHFNDEPIFINFFTSICESAYLSKNKMNYKNLGKNRNSYIYIIGHAEISQALRAFDYKEGCLRITLLDKFFNHQYHLKYNELFGLASNLQYVEGGLKKMKQRMEYINSLGGGYDTTSNDGKLYKYTHFNILKVVKYNYKPTSLKNFSPFEDDWQYHNLLDLTPFKRGKVDILRQLDLINLSDAERKLSTEFHRVMNEIRNNQLFNVDPKIYIFKVATGLGKTKLLEDVEGCLIALDTNKNKEEVSDRMNIGHHMTPSYPVFSIDEVNEWLRNLHDCGLYTHASNVIKKISLNTLVLNKIKYEVLKEDMDKAKIFMSINKLCRETTDTVLTTHRRAVSDKSFRHDTIIFDEDPIQQIVDIGNCSLDFSMFDNTDYEETIKPIEDYLRNGFDENTLENMKTFTPKLGFIEHCASIKKGKLIKLLDSKFVYKDVHEKGDIQYCNVNDFPTNKNIIIMSATAPVSIYKKIYGDRVVVIDISNVKHMGVIEQYTKRSFSQTGFRTYNIEVFKELFDMIGMRPVITHAKTKAIFKKNNYSKFYFGNCSSGDELRGIDIAVIGTPNKPKYTTIFYAKVAGLDIKPSQLDVNDQIVEWNEQVFRYRAFDNIDLRDIQLSLVESELLQAVGRARAVRENSSVLVFSNLPLRIATKMNGLKLHDEGELIFGYPLSKN